MITMNAASPLPPPVAVAPAPLSPPPPPLHHPPPPPPPPPTATEVAAKARAQEREALSHVIVQWNANRLDLFELSEPNEDLEFHGVMRFYFQDSGQKVATKCIRVASSAPATAVVETLIEKFRPDMRMLSVPEYALYEIHENGDERRLADDEKPLLVQLNWHKDDREGRFLLRRIDDKTNVPVASFQESGSSFRRKLSKREKKQLKKQEKLNKLKGAPGGVGTGGGGTPDVAGPDGSDVGVGVAEKLYTELPETSFTRSISNPEAVMRRRRQQKLERKLQQFRSKDGGPDTGGTLKIYGESLCRDVPYKTLLLSVRDTAAAVVREMLAKYGLARVDPSHYCLIQVNVLGPDGGAESSKEYHGGTNREYILDDDECPLAILMNHPSSRGSIMFHVRRRPADYHPRKRKKKPQQGGGAKGGGKNSGGGQQDVGHPGGDLHEYRRYDDSYDRLPFLLELHPDGSDVVNGIPKKHRLQLNVTEVGSEERCSGGVAGLGGGSQSLQLFGPNVQPRHCVVAHTEGIVTVTPCSRDAETYVNGQRIYETTILQNGAVVKFGRIHNFRFLDPSFEDRTSRQRHDSSRQGHDYSDRQSNKDESVVHGSRESGSQGNFETTFDVDGHVETVSSASSSKLQQQQDPDSRSQRSVGSRDGNRSSSNYERYPVVPSQSRPPSGASDPILPAALEFREEATDALLDALVTSLDPQAAPHHFRLAPTYALYLAARFRASTHYRPELTPTERAHRLTALLARVAATIRTVVQERYGDAESLAFWMANASELLHFLKSDRHISAFSLDGQDILAEAVQIAFRNLVLCLQADLGLVMPNFLADRDDDRNEEESAGSVLQVLASAMALLRRCRVNAALTIQLFSQLFHYVNVWAFNRVVASAVASSTNNAMHHSHHVHHVHLSPRAPSYCSREWGLRLGARLARVEAWAERQGLELAADCHLSRITQVAHLLQAPKYNAEDLCAINTACFKLNSLQLRALLTNYQHAPDERRIPMDLVEDVVRVAENVCDDLVRNEGREVRLEEEEGELLRLQFLLPDDGYSCDVIRGLPPGLVELLGPLQRANVCRLVPQHTSAGFWTVYMTPPPSAMLQHSISPESHSQHPQTPNNMPHVPRSPSALSNRSGGMDSSSSRLHGSIGGHLQAQITSPQQQHLEPETQVIKLHKSNSGMGLSIVAAKGAGQDRLGIYIKSVVKGGAADADSRLQAGDQLLKVDGQSLVGITQEKAAEYLVRTGPVVTLEVAKQGAIYHGLATLLSQPSPVMTRAHRLCLNQDWVGRYSLTSRPGMPTSTSLPQLRPPLPRKQQYKWVGSSGTIQRMADKGEQTTTGAPLAFPSPPSATPLLVISQAEEEQPVCSQCHCPSAYQVGCGGRTTTDCGTNTEVGFVDDDVEENSDWAAGAEEGEEENVWWGGVGKGTVPPPGGSPPERSSLSRLLSSSERLVSVSSDDTDLLTSNWGSKCCWSDGDLSHSIKWRERLPDQRHVAVTWRSPREVRMGSGRVAALARHFAALDKNGSSMWWSGASMPDMSQIADSAYEEEGHGICGWKPGTSAMAATTLDGSGEIGYHLLCPKLSPYVGVGGRQCMLGPLGWRPRSEDNLATVSSWSGEDGQRKRDVAHQEKAIGIAAIRPRRMSERDLPSKVQGEHAHGSLGSSGRMGDLLPPPHLPTMHGSKSVPSLNSGHGDVGAMTIGAPPQQVPSSASIGASTPVVRQHQHHHHPQAQQHQPNHLHLSHHEVYNPGYSRTSSTNSIPQKSAGYDGLRSRSSQNLSEPRSPGPVPGQQGLGARQASNPGLASLSQQQHQYSPLQQGAGPPSQQQSNPSQQGAEVERFYQNLSIYRSQQPETSQGLNGFTPPSPNRGKILSPPGPAEDIRVTQGGSSKPSALRGSQSSLHRQVDLVSGSNGTRDRPVSAYIPQNGPQPIQQLQSVPRSQSSRDFMRQEAKLQEMQEEVRRRREGGRPPQASASPPLHHQAPPRSHLAQQQKGSAYSQMMSYPEGAQNSPGHHHGHHQPGNVQHPGGFSSPYHGTLFSPTSSQPPSARGVTGSGAPPPTAPKPRPLGATGDVGPLRPPPPEDVYRDSPPPPPPPPTSTHPLYQGGPKGSTSTTAASSQQNNEGRYNASAGDPPKGSFYPTSSSSQGHQRQFPYAATNPWDREEKEKEQARRREAARLWRDRQISELEALGPGGRGPGQEERLRALRLEREFQRRAEEEEGKGDGEEEEDEEGGEEEEEEEGGGALHLWPGKGGVREAEGRKQGSSGSRELLGNGNPGDELNGNFEESHEIRPSGGLLRMVLSPEESQDYHPSRKSLGALDASNGPQVMHQQVHQTQSYGGQLSQLGIRPSQHHPSGPLRLDNLVVNGMGHGQLPSASSPHHNGTLHSYMESQLQQQSGGPYSPQEDRSYQSSVGSGSQRLDSLLSLGPTSPSVVGSGGSPSPGAPAPPERGSSFAIMSQQQVQQSAPSSSGGVLRNANGGGGNGTTTPVAGLGLPLNAGTPTNTSTASAKRVSFHDSKVVTFDDNANHQERTIVREDPNNFINEAQTMLATPRSPDGSFMGNTPGVIGAQEVYRDPRTRRLAEQQKLMVNRTGPLPEKLSFKEKMKMFAMETGEDGTPKDKVKISRAQRDIEGPIPPNGYSPN